MVATIPERAEVEQSARSRGGLLASALPAPEGWERGLGIPFYGCGEPILRNKCVTATDVAHRPHVASFPSFPIEQGAECSTLSGLDHDAHVTARINATTEWAVGRQLSTDQAGLGGPSLADADVVTASESAVAAVSCLEQAAADTGFGARVFLHATPAAAAYLKAANLIDDNGFSPAGHPWIVSPGYTVLGSPGAARIWATGPVWASVSSADIYPATDHRTNTSASYALRAAIVAFDPCINLAADIEIEACTPPPPPVFDPEASVDPESLFESDLADEGVTISGEGFPPNSTVILTVDAEEIGSAQADLNGDVTFQFTSDDLDPGSVDVVLTSGEWSAETSFTVLADPDPEINVDPDEVTVSDLESPGVVVTGTGFPPNAPIVLLVNEEEVDDDETNGSGGVTFQFTSDDLDPGVYPVELVSGQWSVSATLTVVENPEPGPADFRDVGLLTDEMSVSQEAGDVLGGEEDSPLSHFLMGPGGDIVFVQAEVEPDTRYELTATGGTAYLIGLYLVESASDPEGLPVGSYVASEAAFGSSGTVSPGVTFAESYDEAAIPDEIDYYLSAGYVISYVGPVVRFADGESVEVAVSEVEPDPEP